MFKSSNVMIKEWVLRSIELNQYSFLLALFCPQKVGFFHSRSHRWGLWCCRSHSRPHRWMLWCWDEACLGGAWVQSPIEAEIVIWWPCAHLDRSAWHSIRFGSVDNSRVIFEYVCVEEKSFLGIIHFKLIVSVTLRISPMLCEVSKIHWGLVKQMVMNQIVRTVRVGYVWYSVW